MAYARRLIDRPSCIKSTAGPAPDDPRDPAFLRMRAVDPDLSRLAACIEFDIIPRLMLAHGSEGPSLVRASVPIPGQDDVSEFTRLVIEHDVSVAAAYVEVMRSRGVADETILLKVLAPAARLLGDLWMDDVCSFVEVTVGLASLQQIMRNLVRGVRSDPEPGRRGGRALMAAVPGEQHTFGLFMIEEFFRRAGWAVRVQIPAALPELLSLVGREKYDVVGLSVSCETLLASLGFLIQQVRRASLNPGVRVLVGGHLFLDSPELVARVGADATAVDARQVAMLLPDLLERRRRLS